ncbi:MAG: hypothetical protein EXR69_15805, partial [Myxococcales bacterium]|nr:hypothetical protein [Myxococcales bacterium]
NAGDTGDTADTDTDTDTPGAHQGGGGCSCSEAPHVAAVVPGLLTIGLLLGRRRRRDE